MKYYITMVQILGFKKYIWPYTGFVKCIPNCFLNPVKTELPLNKSIILGQKKTKQSKTQWKTFILLAWASRMLSVTVKKKKKRDRESKQKQRQWFTTTKQNSKSNVWTLTTEWQSVRTVQDSEGQQSGFTLHLQRLCDWTVLAGGPQCVNTENFRHERERQYSRSKPHESQSDHEEYLLEFFPHKTQECKGYV